MAFSGNAVADGQGQYAECKPKQGSDVGHGIWSSNGTVLLCGGGLRRVKMMRMCGSGRFGAGWGEFPDGCPGFFVFCGLPVAGWCRVLSVCENGFFPFSTVCGKGAGWGGTFTGLRRWQALDGIGRCCAKRMPDVGCRMPDAGCRMSDAGCRMPDAGCRMPDAGCRMSDVGCRMSDGGWRMSDVGWRMADGGWRMADGGWRMADGGWRMAGCSGGDAQDGLTVSGRAVAGVAC